MQGNELDKFIDSTGAAGWMDWTGSEQGVSWDSAGVMRLKSNLYYVLYNQDPAALAERLKVDCASIPTPWFVYVYGGDPYKFSEVAKRLTPDKFKIVRLDEFFSAAEKARSRVEGRVWEANANERKTTPP